MKTVSLLRRLVCVALLIMFCAPFAHAQNNYAFARAFGGPGDGTFYHPSAVATDSSGNIFVSDERNNRIQKLDNNGAFLLKFGTYGSGKGQFDFPYSLRTDSSGNLYVVDLNNNRIQKFDKNGNFLLKFGSYGTGDGQFSFPSDIALDSNGNIFVVDSNNNRIQKFDSSGNFLLKFGSQGSGSGQLSGPFAVAIDAGNNVLITDRNNNRVQIFDNNGGYLSKLPSVNGSSIVIDGIGNIFVNNGGIIQKYNSSGNLLTSFAPHYNSGRIAADGSGNIFLADTYSNRILKLDNNGTVLSQIGTYGASNGQLIGPTGIAIDQSGNVWVGDPHSDGFNFFSRVQKFDNNGSFLIKFGSQGSGNGQFSEISGLAVDSKNNLFVGDYGNHRIQKFASSGTYISRFGTKGTGNGQFDSPVGVAIDSSDNVYVVDSISNLNFTTNDRVQKFSNTGAYLSQFGTHGTGDGQFYLPAGIGIDGGGNIFVGDGYNSRVEKFSGNGVYVSQFATGSSGAFGAPGMMADSGGGIFVADYNGNKIRKFDGSGNLITQFGAYGTGDGQFHWATAVATDKSGNVFVVDSYGNRIVVFAPAPASISGTFVFDGLVTTAAAQNVTFTFCSNDGSADIVQTLAVPANGAFTLNGLFSKAGVLHVKGDKYLGVNVPVDLSGGNVTGITATLEPGDANNDNLVNIGDFGLLVNAYGTALNDGTGLYDPNADFNGDGLINIGDFGLLVNSYGDSGAP